MSGERKILLLARSFKSIARMYILSTCAAAGDIVAVVGERNQYHYHAVASEPVPRRVSTTSDSIERNVDEGGVEKSNPDRNIRSVGMTIQFPVHSERTFNHLASNFPFIEQHHTYIRPMFGQY
jgi:hypothetical protein